VRQKERERMCKGERERRVKKEERINKKERGEGERERKSERRCQVYFERRSSPWLRSSEQQLKRNKTEKIKLSDGQVS
jgi:hypothetical protein